MKPDFSWLHDNCAWRTTMSDGFQSPEQLVAQFSIAETQELLTDLRLASTPAHARRFKNLVAELESFDEAIKMFRPRDAQRRAA